MSRSLPLAASLVCLVAPGALAAESGLVLVAGEKSPIAQMAAADARKLFLGMPVLVQGRPVKPIRNATDALATEMFMQRVMFMSAEDYERQIQTRVSRLGGNRPPAYEKVGELMEVLQRDPLAVTYMPRSQAAATAGVRIVGEP